MENLPTLIHDRFCEDRFLEIWTVDERFIVAIDMVNVTGGTTRYWDAQRLYFISTETLEEVRTLTVMNREWEYDRGLLFQFRDNGIVRVMDIATGTHFNDVHLPFPKDDENVGPWPWASLLSFSSSFGISSSCNLVIDCATGRGCTRPEFVFPLLNFLVQIGNFIRRSISVPESIPEFRRLHWTLGGTADEHWTGASPSCRCSEQSFSLEYFH